MSCRKDLGVMHHHGSGLGSGGVGAGGTTTTGSAGMVGSSILSRAARLVILATTFRIPPRGISSATSYASSSRSILGW